MTQKSRHTPARIRAAAVKRSSVVLLVQLMEGCGPVGAVHVVRAAEIRHIGGGRARRHNRMSLKHGRVVVVIREAFAGKVERVAEVHKVGAMRGVRHDAAIGYRWFEGAVHREAQASRLPALSQSTWG